MIIDKISQCIKMSCWIILYLLVCVSQVFGEPKSYIVGGTNGTISRYPHQVSLRMKNKHFCGGSIISEIWVLTAAHCVNKKRSKIVIHVGTHFQFSSRGTEYAINKVILHDFDQRTGLNDIALLNVKEHIKFNQFVQPIALGSTDPLPGTIATITGWGFTDKDGTQMQDQIKAVSLRVISIDECQKYNPIDPEMPDCLVKISNICTLSTSSEGICQGDSGGPLVVGRTQIGVVSFNAQNCALNKPDVYSSVPFYRQWIREKTGV